MTTKKTTTQGIYISMEGAGGLALVDSDGDDFGSQVNSPTNLPIILQSMNADFLFLLSM
jgi:hypothetical protein